jgi:hypothetical protein
VSESKPPSSWVERGAWSALVVAVVHPGVVQAAGQDVVAVVALLIAVFFARSQEPSRRLERLLWLVLQLVLLLRTAEHGRRRG